MRADAYVSVVPASVRGHALPRYEATRLHGGSALFVASPLGLPRRWSELRDPATAAFSQGLDDVKASLGGERLRAGMRAAANAVSSALSCSVERRDADVAALGGLIDRGRLYLARAGAARVYIHRAGRTERVTPRDEPTGGLCTAAAWEGQQLLEPADLILFGSTSAFSRSSTAKVTSVLAQDAGVPLSVLASLLTEPAERAGEGAAVIVLRMR